MTLTLYCRWLRGEQQADLHPFLLTPFGHGTRMCAGRRFAEQDLYVVLARIIARWQNMLRLSFIELKYDEK